MIVVVYTSDPSIHEAQSKTLPQIQGHLRLIDNYLTRQSYVGRAASLKIKEQLVVVWGPESWFTGKKHFLQKPDDLRSVPGAHFVEGKNHLLQVISTLHIHSIAHMCLHSHTYIQNNK